MSLTFASASESSVDAALLLLRLALGPMLFAHGYQKMFLGGRIDGTADWFESMGMKPGRLNAFAASLTEMTTGILMTIGLLTSFAAAGMVGVMIVAAFTHRSTFFVFKDGWEYNYVIAVGAIALAALGAGDWSIDAVLGIRHDLDGWLGLAVAAVLGAASGLGTLALFYRPDRPTQPD